MPSLWFSKEYQSQRGLPSLSGYGVKEAVSYGNRSWFRWFWYSVQGLGCKTEDYGGNQGILSGRHGESSARAEGGHSVHRQRERVVSGSVVQIFR